MVGDCSDATGDKLSLFFLRDRPDIACRAPFYSAILKYSLVACSPSVDATPAALTGRPLTLHVKCSRFAVILIVSIEP